ncbi:hypothetical protein LINPERHAP2_LOCUS100 [Linum perenne]
MLKPLARSTTWLSFGAHEDVGTRAQAGQDPSDYVGTVHGSETEAGYGGVDSQELCR